MSFRPHSRARAGASFEELHPRARADQARLEDALEREGLGLAVYEVHRTPERQASLAGTSSNITGNFDFAPHPRRAAVDRINRDLTPGWEHKGYWFLGLTADRTEVLDLETWQRWQAYAALVASDFPSLVHGANWYRAADRDALIGWDAYHTEASFWRRLEYYEHASDLPPPEPASGGGAALALLLLSTL